MTIITNAIVNIIKFFMEILFIGLFEQKDPSKAVHFEILGSTKSHFFQEVRKMVRHIGQSPNKFRKGGEAFTKKWRALQDSNLQPIA